MQGSRRDVRLRRVARAARRRRPNPEPLNPPIGQKVQQTCRPSWRIISRPGFSGHDQDTAQCHHDKQKSGAALDGPDDEPGTAGSKEPPGVKTLQERSPTHWRAKDHVGAPHHVVRRNDRLSEAVGTLVPFEPRTARTNDPQWRAARGDDPDRLVGTACRHQVHDSFSQRATVQRDLQDTAARHYFCVVPRRNVFAAFATRNVTTRLAAMGIVAPLRGGLPRRILRRLSPDFPRRSPVSRRFAF